MDIHLSPNLDYALTILVWIIIIFIAVTLFARIVAAIAIAIKTFLER